MAPSPPIVDTTLRGIIRLRGLTEEVAELEAGVAQEEAWAFQRMLELLQPVVPLLAKPISVREPWLGSEHERTYPEEGIVVRHSFEQTQGESGRITHEGRILAVMSGGRLIEIHQHGHWREGPPVRDTAWRVESHAVEVTAALARESMRPVLSGILDVLREGIERARGERGGLRQRLNLFQQVDELLERADLTDV